MAVFVQEGSIIEVTVKTSVFSQQCLNVLHYACQPLFPATPQDDVFTAMFSELIMVNGLLELMRDATTNNATIQGVTLQQIRPERYARVNFNFLAAGTDVGVAIAANVAAVITKKTERARDKNAPNKGQIGSFHLAGISTSRVASGLLEEVYITNKLQPLATKLAQTFSDPVLDKIVPVLYHREIEGVLPYDEITECSVQKTARVMRRRTVGLGI